MFINACVDRYLLSEFGKSYVCSLRNDQCKRERIHNEKTWQSYCAAYPAPANELHTQVSVTILAGIFNATRYQIDTLCYFQTFSEHFSLAIQHGDQRLDWVFKRNACVVITWFLTYLVLRSTSENRAGAAQPCLLIVRALTTGAPCAVARFKGSMAEFDQALTEGRGLCLPCEPCPASRSTLQRWGAEARKYYLGGQPLGEDTLQGYVAVSALAVAPFAPADAQRARRLVKLTDLGEFSSFQSFSSFNYANIKI